VITFIRILLNLFLLIYTTLASPLSLHRSRFTALLSLHLCCHQKVSVFPVCHLSFQKSFCLSRMSPNHKWLERSTSFFGFINIIIIAVFWRFTGIVFFY